ncbi:hypothetical protein GOQ04_03270 [Emticicia sp. ODNR4P]|nr:hypothetical protein [Emticicia sp. ODNR4P]
MEQARTPILEKRGSNWIQITNLSPPSFSTKEIEIYKDNIPQPIISDTGLYSNLTNLGAGVYKVRQRINGFYDWSEFSNVIDLTQASAEPTITQFEMVLSAQGKANYSGTGVSGATVKCYRSDTNAVVASAVVSAQGAWALFITITGNFYFTQTEVGKTESLKSVGFTVNAQGNAQPQASVPNILSNLLTKVGVPINGTSDGQGTIRIYRNSHSFGGEYTSVTSSPQGTWSWTPGVSDFGSFFATFQKENTRESDLTAEIVVQKAQLPKPITDASNILTSDIVTIVNSGNYSSYVIKKGTSIAVDSQDITTINLTGIEDKFKFLMPGKYTIIGQRSGYSDSEPSDVIEVTAPQAKVYTITISNLCGSTQSDIQVGVAPLAGDVQVWYDILTAGVHTTGPRAGYPYVTVQLPEMIPSQNRFFIRNKFDTANISDGVSLTI